MTKKNKKKMGYRQYEELLAKAHQRIEYLGSKYQELQAYFIAYVEYRGDNVAFNSWMNSRISQMQNELKKERSEKVSEKV